MNYFEFFYQHLGTWYQILEQEEMCEAIHILNYQRNRHQNLHSISSPLQKPQRRTSLIEFCGARLSPKRKYSSHFIITANIHVILIIRQIFYIKPESRNFNFSTIKLSPHKLSPHLRNITFHIFIRRKKMRKNFLFYDKVK